MYSESQKMTFLVEFVDFIRVWQQRFLDAHVLTW